MTQEEKAKKYDEVVCKLRRFMEQGINPLITRADVQDFFPELAESEDERIRKDLLGYLHTLPNHFSHNGSLVTEWVAWLEKQENHANFCNKIQIGDKVTRNRDGVLVNLSQLNRVAKKNEKQSEQKSIIEMKTPEESLGIDSETYNKIVNECIYGDDKQKPIDNVKPKFKVGDWVVSPNGVYWHIDAIQDGRYEVTADTGQCGNWPLDTNIYRLWTIQDAKPGDVLANGNCPCIFKSINEENAMVVYCGINGFGDFATKSESESNRWDDKPENYYPATKEQRDLLFTKMKESGYEWNSENKELKKISQRMISAEAKEAMYDKPTDLEVFINELSKQFPDVSFAKLSRIAVRVAKWAKPTDEEMKEALQTEYEKGRHDVIEKTLKWLWDLNQEHEIMSYMDSHVLSSEELQKYNKNNIEE